VNERRGRITAADAARAVTLFNELAIHVDRPSSLQPFDATLRLARGHGLSSYDASYLELALREGFPLATLDAQMRRAASVGRCAALRLIIPTARRHSGSQ
jgi:predicted nucleic acid-binding protein